MQSKSNIKLLLVGQLTADELRLIFGPNKWDEKFVWIDVCWCSILDEKFVSRGIM